VCTWVNNLYVSRHTLDAPMNTHVHYCVYVYNTNAYVLIVCTWVDDLYISRLTPDAPMNIHVYYIKSTYTINIRIYTLYVDRK